MKHSEALELKAKIAQGSMRALAVYIEDELLKDSLATLKVTTDHRYYQARTVALEEILKLLPKAQR